VRERIAKCDNELKYAQPSGAFVGISMPGTMTPDEMERWKQQLKEAEAELAPLLQRLEGLRKDEAASLEEMCRP